MPARPIVFTLAFMVAISSQVFTLGPGADSEAEAASCRTATSNERVRATLTRRTLLNLSIETYRCYSNGRFTAYDSSATASAGDIYTFDKWTAYQPRLVNRSDYKKSWYDARAKSCLQVCIYVSAEEGHKVWADGRYERYD